MTRLGITRQDVPSLVVAALLVLALVVGQRRGGAYDLGVWGVGALLVLALLGAVLVGSGGLPRRLGRLELTALAAFLGLAVWSFASMAWAGQPAEAWEGAGRTLLYAALFTLVVLLPWSERTAALALGLLLVAVAAVALMGLVRTGQADPDAFIQGRLAYPVGYQNANACFLMTGSFVALVLAARAATPFAVRVVAFLVLGIAPPVAVLAQSRGSTIAAGLALAGACIFFPARVRTVLVAALAAVPLVALWGDLTALRDLVEDGGPAAEAVAQDAVSGTVLWAVIVTVVGTACVVVDRARLVPARVLRVARTAIGGLVVVAVLIGCVGVAASNPVERARDGWNEFAAGQGATGFGAGLGTTRSDFWRVGLEELAQSPLLGLGADNFQVEYLIERRSLDEPRFAHSLEVGLASQLGIVGIGLGLAVLVAVAVAGFPRRRDPALTQAVAAACLLGASYWLLHASLDWFWEIPGVTAPAVFLAALAVATRGSGSAARLEPVRLGRWFRPAVLVACAAAAVAVAVPLHAHRLVEEARSTWFVDPARADALLDRAGEWNRLSVDPPLNRALIAMELGRRAATVEHLEEAIRRDGSRWYPHVLLGAAASWSGDRTRALRELRTAGRLNPRETLIADLRRRVAAGERVSPAAVQDELEERRVRRQT